MLSSSVALAQTGSIVGTVTDASTGETLPGANVTLAELERGANSDIDGNYAIRNVRAGTYTLTATFVGFRTFRQTVQITAGVETRVDIEMEVGAIGLDEVVVSGYAPLTKREVTGSISSVRARDIQDVPLQNTEGLLQGRAAGVRVTSVSGNPGGAFNVQIRGTGSISAAGEPLYIVDGVQMSFDNQTSLISSSPLNAINPSDIESIEVLKDAGSAAIYGAQAAAGVVIITTKRGREGTTQVTARAEGGVRSLARTVDYIDTDQYLDFYTEGFMLNNGIPLSNTQAFENFRENTIRPFFLANFGSPTGDTQLANFDWQDFIFDDGYSQKYNLSASGGDAKTRFFISGNYEDTEGTAFNNDFTRLAVRTNVDHQVTDRLSGSVSLNVAQSTQFGVCQGGNFINCPASQAMFEPPFSFPFLEDGSFNPNTGFGLTNNPAVVRDEVDRDVVILSIIGNTSLNYRFTDWLDVRGFIGLDYRDTKDNRFDSPVAQPAVGGRLTFIDRSIRNFTTNFRVNARRTFDNVHNFNGFVGVEYRRNFSQNRLVTGEGFPGSFFNVLSASSTPTSAAGTESEWRLGSYFGTVRYNYDERYYLTVIGRVDGHSRFGSDTRWGFFPSFSGSWRISEESFFQSGVVNDLRLRASFGTTGNASIGNFAARGLFSAVGSFQGTTGLTPTQLANVNLGWEEAEEINLGLDFELLNGRISGAVDVFRKDNKDLLLARQLPTDSGFGSIAENIGQVRNEGIEFELSSTNINTRSFMWTSRFNIATTQNEIRSLPEGAINPDSQFNSLVEGEPIGRIRVPRWAGVNPADGRPMWLDGDGNLTFTPTQAEDAVNYKSGVENTFGGFGNTFAYKGVTLDVFFQGSFGQWAFASTDFFFTRTPDFLMSLEEQVLQRWRQPGDITHIPRATLAGGDFPETNNFRTQNGTHAVYNSSFIRLKDITLSYNLPTDVTSRLGLRNVRLFATGLNIVTWSQWPWADPEVAFSPTDIFTNVTTAQLPTERQFSAGIEVSF
ncbi:MAG: SusC/RagA family TonB-linked outer membrane protein [Balneolaceae bacterium]